MTDQEQDQLQHVVVVTMPDRSLWGIPTSAIAHLRATYYAERDTGEASGPQFDAAYQDDLAASRAEPEVLLEWAAGIDWTDVADSAVQLEPGGGMSYDDAWRSAHRELRHVSLPQVQPIALRPVEAIHLDPEMVRWLATDLNRRYANIRPGYQPRDPDEELAARVFQALTVV